MINDYLTTWLFLFAQSDTFAEGEAEEEGPAIQVAEKLSRSPTPTEQHSGEDITRLDAGTPEKLGQYSKTCLI